MPDTKYNGVPYGAIALSTVELDPLPNPHPDMLYVIAWTFPEFTSLCPVSGYPDFATVHLWVVPDQTIVELKSVKLYFNTFRDAGAFHEDVTVTILADIVRVMQPRWARIYIDWSPRGNLHTGTSAVYQPENYPHGAVDFSPVEQANTHAAHRYGGTTP